MEEKAVRTCNTVVNVVLARVECAETNAFSSAEVNFINSKPDAIIWRYEYLALKLGLSELKTRKFRHVTCFHFFQVTLEVTDKMIYGDPTQTDCVVVLTVHF